MDSLELTLEEIILSQVDSLVGDDSDYEVYATPLRPAKSFKELHRQQLINFFKLTDIRENFNQAEKLILEELPFFVSCDEYAKIKSEMDHSAEHYMQFLESKKGQDLKEIYLQEMFGLSNEAMLQLYAFAMDFTSKSLYEQALSLFIFLTTLAPFVPSFWIGEGLVLQALNRHQEALAAFNCSKMLNSSMPASYQYSIDSYINLNEKDQAIEEMRQLKLVIDTLPAEEKNGWLEKLNQYSRYL